MYKRQVFYFPQKTLFDEAATFECGYDSLGDAVDLKNEAQQTIVPYEDILNEPIKNIDPNKPMIALTFDDGPSKRYTPAILDALKEYGANATFFVLGSNADNFPDILQRMVLEGNEIGNHTYSHKQLTTLSKENIEDKYTPGTLKVVAKKDGKIWATDTVTPTEMCIRDRYNLAGAGGQVGIKQISGNSNAQPQCGTKQGLVNGIRHGERGSLPFQNPRLGIKSHQPLDRPQHTD